MSGISWKTNVGVNHVGAYQVSGRPFATGSINATHKAKVEFPKVTRWIYVVNHGAADCRVGRGICRYVPVDLHPRHRSPGRLVLHHRRRSCLARAPQQADRGKDDGLGR